MFENICLVVALSVVVYICIFYIKNYKKENQYKIEFDNKLLSYLEQIAKK